jgi:hypothetical protein
MLDFSRESPTRDRQKLRGCVVSAPENTIHTKATVGGSSRGACSKSTSAHSITVMFDLISLYLIVLQMQMLGKGSLNETKL